MKRFYLKIKRFYLKIKRPKNKTKLFDFTKNKTKHMVVEHCCLNPSNGFPRDPQNWKTVLFLPKAYFSCLFIWFRFYLAIEHAMGRGERGSGGRGEANLWRPPSDTPSTGWLPRPHLTPRWKDDSSCQTNAGKGHKTAGGEPNTATQTWPKWTCARAGYLSSVAAHVCLWALSQLNDTWALLQLTFASICCFSDEFTWHAYKL